MLKSLTSLLAVELMCVAAIGQEAAPSTVLERVVELRKDWRQGVSEQVNREREITVAALVVIVKDESPPGSKSNLDKNRALKHLGHFPDARDAVSTLVSEIDYGKARYVDSSPTISYYPAAMSLIRIGVPARAAILRSLSEPLSDHKLSLMVSVLVELDRDGDDMDGLYSSRTALTMFRLTQELEQLKSLPVAPDVEESRRIRVKNIQRMIALLLEPNFGLELPGAGVQK